MATTQPTHPYESYAPKSSNQKQCAAQFFDKLGFKSAQASAEMRANFVVDMKNNLSSPSPKSLHRRADPKAFKIVVSGFLVQYGPKYWGDSKRDHLQEPDTLKGFLCPRDAQRKGSVLLKTVEGFYNYTATKMKHKEKKKANTSKANGTRRHIELNHSDAIEPSNSRKRSATLREPEDEEEAGRAGSSNGFEGVESPQRDRHLPNSEESTKQTQTLEDDPIHAYGVTASREPFLPERQASSTRGSTNPIASGKLNKRSKRSHLFMEDPSTETAIISSFQTQYPRNLTPPLSSTPEPDRSNVKSSVISCDSDAGEEQRVRKEITTSLGRSAENDYNRSIAKIARGFEDVKTEPLTDNMMKRTMFLVTVHDSPMGPVPVPFTECGNFHVLFPTLIEERGVSDEDAKKIDNITTIFTWTGGQFGGRVGGIRKNKPGDWVYFCNSLRKAHEMDADRFKGKCEVAIKLHISDRHKEQC